MRIKLLRFYLFLDWRDLVVYSNLSILLLSNFVLRSLLNGCQFNMSRNVFFLFFSPQLCMTNMFLEAVTESTTLSHEFWFWKL
jgi:hypothetical protein